MLWVKTASKEAKNRPPTPPVLAEQLNWGRVAMFAFFARCITWVWPLVLGAWVAVVVVLWFVAPPWQQVGKSGQFTYLPSHASTRQAETLFNKAFPGERAASGIVLVVTRTDGGELQPEDRRFVADVLAPRLRQEFLPNGSPASGSPVIRIRSASDKPTGVLLESADRRAELIAIELNREFLSSENWPTVAAVEQLVQTLRSSREGPTALDIALTGSAVLGRDIGQAETHSAIAVQRWTIVVVVGILLLVYRAPLLAVIPLAVVFVGLEVSLRLLGLLAEVAHLNVYQGVRPMRRWWVMVRGSIIACFSSRGVRSSGKREPGRLPACAKRWPRLGRQSRPAPPL